MNGHDNAHCGESRRTARNRQRCSRCIVAGEPLEVQVRILTLTTIYPPHVGGAPSLIARFVTSLQNAGHDVEVITFGADKSNNDLAKREAEFDRHSRQSIHRLASTGMNSRTIVQLLLLVLRTMFRQGRKGNRYDVVFCAVAYPCAPIARVAGAIFRLRYVVYAHGEDVTVVERGTALMAAVKARMLRASLRRAAVVFANSMATIARLNEIGYRSPDVVLLPPSFDPTRFVTMARSRIDDLRGELGLGDRRMLLTIARLTSPRKGHDIVIQALALLLHEFPDLHYVIVGTGDQSVLRQLAEGLNVSDHVTIVDTVSDDELPVYLHAADVYVMPSRWDPVVREGEGFGIVYLEAAAAGRPSVASRTGGAAEAVIDHVTGLTVDPESPLEVRDAIRTLLINSELARQLGENGRRRAISDYANDRVLPPLEAALSAAARQ